MLVHTDSHTHMQWSTIQPEQCILSFLTKMNGSGQSYSRWDKPDTERRDLSCIRKLSKSMLKYNNRIVAAGGSDGARWWRGDRGSQTLGTARQEECSRRETLVDNNSLYIL